MKSLHFQLKNGSKVPAHFHVTEIEKIKKLLLTVMGLKKKRISFQLL